MSDNLKLETSKNIKNLKIDNSKTEEIISFAETVADSTAFDPEVLSYAELNIDNYSHVCLVNLADTHFFDQGMIKPMFDKASEFLNKTSNAYSVLAGDTFTVSTLNGASNAHMEKLNNTVSSMLGERLLKKIDSKILFGVGGNHDGEHGARNRESNIGLTREVLKGLKIPYFQYNALLKINVYNNPFYVFVTHGSGKSSSKAGALDIIKRKCENVCARFGIYPNLILTGHFHADVNGRYLVQVPVYKDGKIVSTKTQELVVESAPALQGDSEFTTSNNFDMTPPNVNAFDITFRKNPYYNTQNQYSESPIIWEINKFPLLKSPKKYISKKSLNKINEHLINSDLTGEEKQLAYDVLVKASTKFKYEFTTPAEIYIQKYLEPQDLKEKVDEIVSKKGFEVKGLKQAFKKLGEEVKSL